MSGTAFLDDMDEYDTLLEGCNAKGFIQVLPDLKSGELWNGRKVIRYRFL